MQPHSLARRRISTFMNRDLVVTRRDARLAPVVEMMMRRNLEEVPVVDHDHALLGTLSRGDLLRSPSPGGSAEEFLAQQGSHDSVTCELGEGFRLDVEACATVGDVMNRNVVCVHPESTAAQAAALMAEHDLSELPVVGADGGLIGRVSALDIARLLN
jgi:acetoin utilization protein AcuB